MNLKEKGRTLSGQGHQGGGQNQTLAQTVIVDMPDIRWASQLFGGGSKHLRCQCQRGNLRTVCFVLQARDDSESTGEIEQGRLAGEDDRRQTSVAQGILLVTDNPGDAAKLQMVMDNRYPHLLSPAGCHQALVAADRILDH